MDEQLERDLQLDRPIPDVFRPDEGVVQRRAAAYSAVDPFPDVPPALLSTVDLLDYVAATGMIDPFRIDLDDPASSLKPATYGVPVLGAYVSWEMPDSADAIFAASGPQRNEGVLIEGEPLLLRPNTITYVTLEPHFRLPRYIAARFNLNIRDIYRGILVGTGPLVDPGFDGTLSVPLHNLTSNEYTLVGGEVLVWMEFTKLSPAGDSEGGWRKGASAECPARRGFFVAFPQRKKDLSLNDYLMKAHPGPIVSSIPTAIGASQRAAVLARHDAQKAQEDAKSSRTTIRNLGIGGLVATVIAIAAILVPTWGLINDVGARSDDSSDQIVRLETQIKALQATNRAQARSLNRLETAVRSARRRP